MTFNFPVAVERLRRPAGSSSWKDATVETVASSWVEANTSTVDESAVQAEQRVTSTYTLYTPPSADVRQDDRIRFDGVLYEVDVVPSANVNPFSGWQPVRVVPLRLIT